MKNKIHPAYIILICVLLISFFTIIYSVLKDKTLNLNGLEIKSSQLSDIIKVVPEGEFIICDIEKNKCFLFDKQRLE